MARLIDLDKIKPIEFPSVDMDGLDVVRYLNTLPTVDAEEVVHGRWVDEYPYVRCSECNAEWINCITDNEPKLFYYCPNCGAKMDGERK